MKLSIPIFVRIGSSKEIKIGSLESKNYLEGSINLSRLLRKLAIDIAHFIDNEFEKVMDNTEDNTEPGKRMILKFPLHSNMLYETDIIKINMPKRAEILNFQVEQNGEPILWAYVDLTEESVTRYFSIVGTGVEIPEEIGSTDYIGTWQTDKGLSFHIFENFLHD